MSSPIIDYDPGWGREDTDPDGVSVSDLSLKEEKILKRRERGGRERREKGALGRSGYVHVRVSICTCMEVLYFC